MDKIKIELSFQQQITLNLLEAQASFVHAALKSLDDKAQGVINISSLIVALISTFKLQWFNVPKPLTPDANRVFLCIFVAYGFAFLYSMLARFPLPFAAYPIEPTEDEISKWINTYTPPKYYASLIVSYAGIIRHNRQLLAFKSVLTRAATIVIGIVMFLIALLVMGGS